MSGSVESLGHGEEVGILSVEVQSLKGERTDKIRFTREPMYVHVIIILYFFDIIYGLVIIIASIQFV